MAELVSPVIPDSGLKETLIGAPDGTGWVPAPAVITNQHIIVRWRFSPEERAMIALTGDVWLVFPYQQLPAHMPTAFKPTRDANGDLMFMVHDPLQAMEKEMTPEPDQPLP